jgi:hypothetical protein
MMEGSPFQFGQRSWRWLIKLVLGSGMKSRTIVC